MHKRSQLSAADDLCIRKLHVLDDADECICGQVSLGTFETTREEDSWLCGTHDNCDHVVCLDRT